MALIEFELDDETARRVAGFFKSGRRGALTFHVENHRVVMVECLQSWTNATRLRHYIPGASGVSLLTNGADAL